MLPKRIETTPQQAIVRRYIAWVLATVPFVAGAFPALSQGAAPTSEVKTLAIAAAHEIPKAPPKSEDAESCQHLTKKPSTAAGRLVAGQGWAITGEVALPDGIQAISFVGKFEQGTSGSCLLSDGNVAIFRGDALVAIAYAPRGAKDTIGSILPLEGGRARIWSGDYLSQPLADLLITGEGAPNLVPLAPLETRCGGKAVVPNVYGVPIDKARKLFVSNGWSPVPGKIGKDRAEQGREIDLVKGGVVEVESCSGTGFGYCGFNYRGSAGTLAVTTVGDGDYPNVSDYGVTCR
ncbi:hypothetical protein HCU64_00690 [Methylobacterium sp. C25]|uniref:hypothetical protein n=1 Tax=Methylobacterium sp. C25 TaxID=2721622 RepID=UPI001F180CE0|nr:hypothetical protein [Methylobacterium sp. C25]MCE4222255.1 hypothetical protein [Methylobacterium sp. C25]